MFNFFLLMQGQKDVSDLMFLTWINKGCQQVMIPLFEATNSWVLSQALENKGVYA